jgi:hypothetical protein
MARGGVYAATIGLPAYNIYSGLRAQGMTGAQAGTHTINRFAGIGIDGKFDSAHLVEMWGPVAAWTAVDFVLKRAGVWRKMGTMLRM